MVVPIPVQPPIDISVCSNYCILKDVFDNGTLCELYDFYLYKAARKDISPASLGVEERSDTDNDALWGRLLIAAGVDASKFIGATLLRNKITEIRALELSDNTLRVDSVKGFVHTPNNRRVHFLSHLLTRIRNSFAHGRIAVFGDFILLEDQATELTARIVLSIPILLNWKEEILSAIR